MSEPRRVFRSIASVIAGVLVVFILSLGTDALLHAAKIYPPWFQPMSDRLFLLATAYRIVYGILGGYVTALLAPNHPMRHAIALGIVGVVLSILGAMATLNAGPELGPKWYPLALVVTAFPCSWLGGKIRVRQTGA